MIVWRVRGKVISFSLVMLRVSLSVLISLFWDYFCVIVYLCMCVFVVLDLVSSVLCCLGNMLSMDAAVEARIQIYGMNSGSWYHYLPIGIYH